MKKAYVKPVFLAEEFVAAASHVAGCGDGSVNSVKEIIPGTTYLCEFHDNSCNSTLVLENSEANKLYGSHDENFKGSTDLTYWDYAKADSAGSFNDKIYLFTQNDYECDFVWTGYRNDTVKVWGTLEKEKRSTTNVFYDTFKSLTGFFRGSEAVNGHHPLGYNGSSFFS